MAFYVKRSQDFIEEFTDPQAIVERMPERKTHFDQFADDRKIAEDLRLPSNWGSVMGGAGEYKKVARIPEPVWAMLMKLYEAGMCPDPLKDDKFFYGLLFKHPQYQAYPMRRSA